MLNQARVVNRRSLPMMLAIGQAFSGKISDQWFESITDSQKDAAKAAAKYKASANDQKGPMMPPNMKNIRGKTGWRPLNK